MGVVIALLVLSLIFGLLEGRFSALPKRSIWRRERRVDFLYWFFTPFVSRTISSQNVSRRSRENFRASNGG